jgi:hypothetical protein
MKIEKVLVAQLDRALNYELKGCGFKPCRAYLQYRVKVNLSGS